MGQVLAVFDGEIFIYMFLSVDIYRQLSRNPTILNMMVIDIIHHFLSSKEINSSDSYQEFLQQKMNKKLDDIN